MLTRRVFQRTVMPALASLPTLAAVAFNEAASAAPVRSKLPLVMLDPGHGGMDPGAIGVSGTFEKYIAINTAMELRRQLLASGRYRVAMTRTRDVFIPLDQRVVDAQRNGASLFVSMHADAIADPAVRGASVYTLASHPSDAQSAMLAQSENAADRFASGQGSGAPSAAVTNILASLVRRETRTESALMQRAVVDSLARNVPLLVNPARHAGFIVLQSAEIPSVLVEMGFMSNRADEAALRQPAHRAVVAAALKGAVDRYFAAVATGAPLGG
ncbi:MAG: N-acetylmuramoyl-L-alanine amidase [Rhodospirillales bacterium]|nr:N-acetylmuramoyl-L-alanine amidase [Rhodospirillales bacterium]